MKFLLKFHFYSGLGGDPHFISGSRQHFRRPPQCQKWQPRGNEKREGGGRTYEAKLKMTFLPSPLTETSPLVGVIG